MIRPVDPPCCEDSLKKHQVILQKEFFTCKFCSCAAVIGSYPGDMAFLHNHPHLAQGTPYTDYVRTTYLVVTCSPHDGTGLIPPDSEISALSTGGLTE